MHTKYGLQMYSVRDLAEVSLRDALAEVAKLGYKYIEFAGFFGNDAKTVKSWLDEFGLVCSGTHTTVNELTPDKIDNVIKYHKEICCNDIIVPGADWATPEKNEQTLNALVSAQKILAENGIGLSYHNHSREFLATSDGIVFENEILNKTDLQLEIDVFWLYNAGIDVMEYLNAHKERIGFIHLKDGFARSRAGLNFENAYEGVRDLSLGLGEVPIEEIRKWAIKNNVLQVVESESLQPSGIEEVARCIEYLKTLD